MTEPTQDSYVGGQRLIQIEWSDPTQPGVVGDPATDPATGYKLVNPTTVTLTVRKPDGTEVAPTIAVSGFVYTARVALDQPGAWWYGWAAAGSYIGYQEGVFRVRQKRA